ncbi:MAG: hypothetical protein IKF07_08305 [Eubacterium sp.]|nr:hypothetical protein [Eubacterium sp.]
MLKNNCFEKIAKVLTILAFVIVVLIVSCGMCSVYAESGDATISLPAKDTTVYAGGTLKYKAYTQADNPIDGTDNYLIIEIDRGTSRVYFNTITVDRIWNTLYWYSTKCTKSGTYKIKAGAEFNASSEPTTLTDVADERTFIVKKASALKSVKPKLHKSTVVRYLPVWEDQGVTGVKLYRASKKNGKYKCIKTIKTTQTVKDDKTNGSYQLTEKQAKGKYFKIRYYVKNGAKTTYSKYSNILKF